MFQVMHGDCRDVMPNLLPESIDAIITDPPYPEIDRHYGKLTEAEWWDLMMIVCAQSRRVLKPEGSAMFILQPNSKHVGSMRGWLFEFQAWACKEWNMVQDAWWWNFTTPPNVHAHRDIGLMRPSLKACVWLGPANCYRNQDAVLWSESLSNAAKRGGDRALQYRPSGYSIRTGRIADTTGERGGSTPFNLLPIANADSSGSSGASGHGAGTPDAVADWWMRYLVPAGGKVLDPFCGAGSTGKAAVGLGLNFIGIEQSMESCAMAEERIDRASQRSVQSLFDDLPQPKPEPVVVESLFSGEGHTA